MKLISFSTNGDPTWGAVLEDGVVDLGTAQFPTLRSALAADATTTLLRQSNSARFALDELTFLPPVPNPAKIICVGVNYKAHGAEIGVNSAHYPTLFSRFPSTLVGHGRPILRPKVSEEFDYEGELAVVIGRRTHRVSADAARDSIAGYSCFADNSIRDFQRHTSQPLPGKNFDSSGSWGPYLVTPDEIGNISGLTLRTWLNGNVVQRDTLSNMIFNPEALIAYISMFTELLPGDVIAAGTPAGVGVGRDPKLFMKAGDALEVEIEKIGVLRNTVIDE